MKKKVLAVLCAVVVGVSSLTVSASASVMATIGTIITGAVAVKETIESVVEFCDFCVEVADGVNTAMQPIYKDVETRKYTYLTIWNEIISSYSISESDFRSYIGSITSEEYYWMFADCNASIDDIADYCYRTSDKSGAAFEKVKSFVVNNGFTENQLRTLHNACYVNRTKLYDFTSNTMRCGLTIDDICAHCYVSGVPTDNPDTGFDEDGNVQVSGKTFSEICSQLQEQYAPDEIDGKLSWLEGDAYFPPSGSHYYNFGYDDLNCMCNFPVFLDGNWCDTYNTIDSLKGVYLLPYYFDGSEYYYSDISWHVYAKSPDSDEVDPHLFVDTSNNFDDSVSSTSDLFSLLKVRYFIFGFLSPNKQVFYVHTNDTASFGNGTVYSSNFSLCSDGYNFYNADSESLGLTTSTYNTAFSFSTVEPTESDVKDVGFFWSTEPIEMGIGRRIDPTSVDPNVTITFTGDNIYNYTVTDPDTGGSSTVNEYVTNNYTITNNYGSDGDDSGSSGGTTSGDINVGGNIGVNGNVGVNGQVDVNFNLNVNTGSDGSGGTAEVDPYEYEKVNMGEALEQIPEMSDGFTAWFSRVFGFLPPELMGLLLGGITLAILLRIAGR